MAQESECIAVTTADPQTQRSALETLLEEYHAWLASEAREWAAKQESATAALPEEGYDPTTGAAEDVETLADPGSDVRGFLASYEGEAAGVVLLYGVSEGMAELKRLYVRPTYREHGIGRALCRAAIEAADERGYGTVGLTTPPWSEGAHALYEDLEFAYTGPYPETKLPEHLHEDALFMQRDLSS
jgi:GNAT superfamily N-acetyltransferase